MAERAPTLADLFFAHQALVREIAAHNCGVTIRRRRGEDWTAPENQYRNAIAEIEALHPEHKLRAA